MWHISLRDCSKKFQLITTITIKGLYQRIDLRAGLPNSKNQIKIYLQDIQLDQNVIDHKSK